MKKQTQMLLKHAALFSVTGCFLFSAASGQPLLHYNFDEESGDALDHGAAPAAPGVFLDGADRTTNTPSVVGSIGDSQRALDLTTSGAHVSGGDADKLDGLSQFTLSTWLNLQSDPSGNIRLVSKQSEDTFDGFSWNIYGDDVVTGSSASQLSAALFIGGDNGFAHDFSNAPNSAFDADDTWLFMAVSYDGTSGTDNVNYYAGTEDSTVSLVMTTSIDGGALVPNDDRFMLGRTDAASGASVNPDGYMDDFRYYGEELTLAELEAVRLAIPEPSTYALIAGLGVFGLVVFRRFRGKKA